jgi:hypothetical protein
MYRWKKIINKIIDGLSWRILRINDLRLLDRWGIKKSLGNKRKYLFKRKFKINGKYYWWFYQGMRKSSKNYSNINRETRKNLIIDVNIDELGSIKLK